FGDNYGGEWPKAEVAKKGIAYELSELHKSDLYFNLISVFCSRKGELLGKEKLKNELCRVERRRGRSGQDSIEDPPRGRGDIANAVAGVTYVTLEHSGQSTMPEAYGERVCTNWNFYMEGLANGSVRDRYW